MQNRSLKVFPTTRSLKEYLFSFKKIDTLLSNTLTIDDFFKKSVDIEGYKYIQEEQRLILLNEAIKNIDIEKLGISKSFAQFLKQSEYIYRFFLELASEQVSINDIKNVDTYEFYIEHLEILNQILQNYTKLLEENSYVDKINLNKHYKLNSGFLSRFNEILIIFEGYITKQEFTILEKISQVVNLSIQFVKNDYNTKSTEIFKELNYNFKDGYLYKINLSSKTITKETKQEPLTENLVIQGFASRFNQVAFIKTSITKLISLNIDTKNIAIILPNEEFVNILELNDSEGYFNFAMGKSIINKELYQKTNSIYLYIKEQNLETIEALKFFEIDKIFIDTNLKPIWQKNLTKISFNEIVNFLIKDEANEELKKKFEEMIYKLSIIFFSNKNSLRVKDAYKIILQNLSKIKLDDAHSGKITVMGVLETRAIEFDAIIICDFNENYIPKISLKDKFLSSKIKALANLPTRKDRENLQKYYYKRVIDNSKQVFISYVSSSEDQISRFAYELFKDIKENLQDERYEDILYKNYKLEYKDEQIKKKIDLCSFIWSASSLKIFLDCKRKWYLKYILQLKEHSISELPKPFKVGDIIHKILEDFYKNPQNTISSIDSLFFKYKEDNPFLVLDLEIYKQKIVEFLKQDLQNLKTRTIIAIEKPFSTTFNDFTISGVIDRIDKSEDSLELIDYKTSRNLKVDTLKTYNKSTDFQLEFYFLATKNLYQSSNIKAFYYDLFENSIKEEVVLSEKLELLKTIFDDIKVLSKEEIGFCKTENSSTCEYCTYKTICNRD